jgi:hypothetical protein
VFGGLFSASLKRYGAPKFGRQYIMKRHFGALAALAIAGTLGLAACDDANGPTLTNSGKVNVLLTDAPFPLSEVKSVNIFVTRIDAKLADTDSA